MLPKGNFPRKRLKNKRKPKGISPYLTFFGMPSLISQE